MVQQATSSLIFHPRRSGARDFFFHFALFSSRISLFPLEDFLFFSNWHLKRKVWVVKDAVDLRLSDFIKMLFSGWKRFLRRSQSIKWIIANFAAVIRSKKAKRFSFLSNINLLSNDSSSFSCIQNIKMKCGTNDSENAGNDRKAKQKKKILCHPLDAQSSVE